MIAIKEPELERHELYGGDIVIEFDRENHKYYRDGKQLTSVTTITGSIEDKPWLAGWAAKMCAEYLKSRAIDVFNLQDQIELDVFADDMKREFRRKSKDARDIGSLIHWWLEDWRHRAMPDDPKARIACGAFLEFEREHRIEVKRKEFIVYSMEHDIVGTVDADGSVTSRSDIVEINDKEATIDWKSGTGTLDYWYETKQGWKKGTKKRPIDSGFYLQTALYDMAICEEKYYIGEHGFGKEFRPRYIFRLGKDGTFDYERRDPVLHASDYEAAKHAIALYKWRQAG